MKQSSPLEIGFEQNEKPLIDEINGLIFRYEEALDQDDALIDGWARQVNELRDEILKHFSNSELQGVEDWHFLSFGTPRDDIQTRDEISKQIQQMIRKKLPDFEAILQEVENNYQKQEAA